MRRRVECFINLQTGHVLCQSVLLPAVPYSEGKQHQPQRSRTCFVYNKVIQTGDSAYICSNNITLIKGHKQLLRRYYMGTTLGKPNHYTIVMGYINAQRAVETATGKRGHEMRKERDNTLVDWATSRKYKIKNTMFQNKAGKRWT